MGVYAKLAGNNKLGDSVPPAKQQEVQIWPVCSNAMKSSS